MAGVAVRAGVVVLWRIAVAGAVAVEMGAVFSKGAAEVAVIAEDVGRGFSSFVGKTAGAAAVASTTGLVLDVEMAVFAELGVESDEVSLRSIKKTPRPSDNAAMHPPATKGHIERGEGDFGIVAAAIPLLPLVTGVRGGLTLTVGMVLLGVSGCSYGTSAPATSAKPSIPGRALPSMSTKGSPACHCAAVVTDAGGAAKVKSPVE